MNEMTRHLDEIGTHLVSDAVWEVLRVLASLAIGYTLIWFGKAGINSSKSKVILSLFALLLFVFSISAAFQTHHRSGFFNGVLFATNCIVSFLFMLVASYLFTKRFFPAGVKRVDWAKNHQRWTINRPTGCLAGVDPSARGLQFGAQFDGTGDRWANMEIRFAQAQDLRGWVGISFDIKCDHVYPDSKIFLQVGMSNGSLYSSSKPIQIRSQRALFLFQEMQLGYSSQENPHGYLELQEIVSVAIGCKTPLDDVTYHVDNFALIKFTETSS